MEAELREVRIHVDTHQDGSPLAYPIAGQEYCQFSWTRGAGPPFSSGIDLWLGDNDIVLYIGKATSNRTSHLYRRITAYKRVTPGKSSRRPSDGMRRF